MRTWLIAICFIGFTATTTFAIPMTTYPAHPHEFEAHRVMVHGEFSFVDFGKNPAREDVERIASSHMPSHLRSQSQPHIDQPEVESGNDGANRRWMELPAHAQQWVRDMQRRVFRFLSQAP